MSDFVATKELTGTLSVLCVEDEPQALETVKRILQRLFERVETAGDGEAGLARFLEARPDIVITDIRMPRMDGLEMLEAIKQEVPDQQCIILSAHNDTQYFTRAIELGVDAYILKPLQSVQMNRAITKVAQKIRDARELEGYRTRLESRVKEEVAKNIRKDEEAASMLKSLVEGYPNPVILYAKNRVAYTNGVFLEMTSPAMMKRLETGAGIDALFVGRDGYMASCAEYREGGENKVLVDTPSGRRIFLLIRREVDLKEGGTGDLYVFNDITSLEYRKLKIEHYSERLQDLIIFKYKRHIAHGEQPKSTPAVQEEMSGEPGVHKLAASDYVVEMNDYIMEQVMELQELQSDFEELLFHMEDHFDLKNLAGVSKILFRYASTISLLMEFSDLAFSLKSLSDLLQRVTTEQLEGGKEQRLVLILEGLQKDLTTWRETIFITRATGDIHYLDSSLFSSALQIEALLFETNADEENELELF